MAKPTPVKKAAVKRPAPAPAAPAAEEETVAPSFTVAAVTDVSKLSFPKPAGLRGGESIYTSIVEQAMALPVGKAMVLRPNPGTDIKQLRNRVTAPIRTKAQPYAQGRLRIRVTEAGDAVAIVCEEWPAEEAAEGEQAQA